MVNKKIVDIIAGAYLKVRKAYLSDFLYKHFADKWRSKNVWLIAREYNTNEFSNFIGTFEYLSDPAGGAIDFSHQENDPEYFFADLTKGRDCDDFSLIWKSYLKYHIDEWEDIHQVVCLNRRNLKSCFMTSHFITVAKNKKDGLWYCFNYIYTGNKHNTIEEAIYEVCKNGASSTYTKENIWYKIYD